ncbi:MAG: hypothetical protein VX904_09730, partial [Planctomycetota bacterium]|nr:hypothetical protein [Planctomycetota bacterium]
MVLFATSSVEEHGRRKMYKLKRKHCVTPISSAWRPHDAASTPDAQFIGQPIGFQQPSGFRERNLAELMPE